MKPTLPDLRKTFKHAKFVLEGTKTPLPNAMAPDEFWRIEAVGSDGARAYWLSATEIGLYLPKYSKRYALPGVRFHQRGDSEVTLAGDLSTMRKVCALAGVNTR